MDDDDRQLCDGSDPVERMACHILMESFRRALYSDAELQDLQHYVSGAAGSMTVCSGGKEG